MPKQERNKKQKTIQRLKSRSSVGAQLTQKQIDIALIDLVLKKLFNNGDKEPASLEDDILQPAKVKFTKEGMDRLWDLLMSTGLVSPVIGFGRSGRLSITPQGYQLMNEFGSYSAFIKQRQEEAANNQQTTGTQFIITGTDGDNDKENPDDNDNIGKAAHADDVDKSQ